MPLWFLSIIFLISTQSTHLFSMDAAKISLLESQVQPSAPEPYSPLPHEEQPYFMETPPPSYNPYVHQMYNQQNIQSSDDLSCCTKVLLCPASVLTCCLYGIGDMFKKCCNKKSEIK